MEMIHYALHGKTELVSNVLKELILMIMENVKV